MPDFQSSFAWNDFSWGVAPGWDEGGPLALALPQPPLSVEIPTLWVLSRVAPEMVGSIEEK